MYVVSLGMEIARFLFFYFKLSQARWSPVFFFIYFDELLGQSAQAGVGCYIGNIFLRALLYADDVVLLSPTARAMRLMLGICVIIM